MDANWQRCLHLFLTSIEDISGSTASREAYRSTLARFFSDPGKSPADYTRVDVLEFVQRPSDSRRNPGSPVKAATKNRRLSVLHSFYRFASSYEVNGETLFQKRLPTSGLHYLKPDIRCRAMSAEELERFFSAIPDTPKGRRDRALYLTYFWTARRRAEIYALRWRDIEPAVLTDPDGTRREGYIYRFYPKGGHRQVKTAELPLPAWNAIYTYLERSGRLVHMQPDDPIFLAIHPGVGRRDHKKNMPLNYNFVANEFKRYCKLAGLRPELSLHSLRHTAAHLRHQAGQDILEIKELLGHARLETTWGYLRVMGGVADPGAKLLESRFAHLGMR